MNELILMKALWMGALRSISGHVDWRFPRIGHRVYGPCGRYGEQIMRRLPRGGLLTLFNAMELFLITA